MSFFDKKESPSDKNAFNRDIKKAMYADYGEKRESRLFKEISMFCIAAGKSPNPNSISTICRSTRRA